MKYKLLSSQNFDVVQLERRSACPELVEGWGIFNHLDSGTLTSILSQREKKQSLFPQWGKVG
jgi:hypothetical protein